MYELFKNIAEKNSCKLRGACSIHPSLNLLNYALLLEIKEISFYLIKLKEFGITNNSTAAFLVEILSIFLINTNYNQQKYLQIIKKLSSIKEETRKKYIDFCTQKNIPYETIQVNLNSNTLSSVSQIISQAQNNLVKLKDNISEDKIKLFELTATLTKLASIDVSKLKKYDKNNIKYDYEIIRFLALSNSFSIRNDKITRRIYEFSNLFFEIKKELLSLYEDKYGKKNSVEISTNLKKGHNILVSGNDLIELEKLLTQIEAVDSKEKINVYTHGAMILAHLYPYFKNNKLLVGHFGDDNAEYDFSNFTGVILVTQNFIQKIDNLYRGELFSNKIISFNKMLDIENDDYSSLINMSLTLQKTTEETNKNPITINYNDPTKNILENLKENEELIIIIGTSKEELINDNIETKKIIHLKCPFQDDILYKFIDELKEKNVKVSLFFSQCNLYTLAILLTLLDKKLDLNIANCPNALISPHITEILENNFGVKIIH